jgi:hypothetical protein
MQTVLLAREIDCMMRWDGDCKDTVNCHFDSVIEIHRTMGYIGNLSIEDVLKSVLMATLEVSLSISSKTFVPASFDDTLTSSTLLHGITTIPELQSVP